MRPYKSSSYKRERPMKRASTRSQGLTTRYNLTFILLGLVIWVPMGVSVVSAQGKPEFGLGQKVEAGSVPKRLPIKITSKDGATMVLIPDGEFLMGSDDGFFGGELPVHRVHLNAFYLDTYEVTTSRYATFLHASGRTAPKYWNHARQVEHREKPVVGVDWHDAQAYCAHYGRRLPTEAEWEKAARGTDGRWYPWGNDPPTKQHANFDQCCAFNEYGVLTTVGSRPAGKGPYGVHDMAGNVMEWVADWYDENYYRTSPARNPHGPSNGQYRVLRSGSWGDIPIGILTVTRDWTTPMYRTDRIGFRCAQDVR